MSEGLVDQATIFVRAGHGGNGSRSFRREKFVAQGGPDGGDGGRGGNVYLVADDNLHTLLDFKRKVHHVAGDASNGQSSRKHGRDGSHLEIRVPLGTVVFDRDTEACLGDLVEPGDRVLVARGGQGGRGNTHFATAQRQIPRHAEVGELGEERWLKLDLQMMADVGLVGFPNAGKSTLLSVISRAEPKVGDYPFTTLQPILGVVYPEEGSPWIDKLAAQGRRGVVVADLPGLVEGASQGAGLGLRFLRHIERTRVLIHVLDLAAVKADDPLANFRAIRRELEQYSPALTRRPEVLAVNKCEISELAEALEHLRSACREVGRPLFEISCHRRWGLEPLIEAVFEELDRVPQIPRRFAEPLPDRVRYAFTVEWEVDVWRVRGPEVERAVKLTNFAEVDSLRSLQTKLLNWGVEDELLRQGAEAGQTVRIGKHLFDFEPTPGWARRPSKRRLPEPEEAVEVRPSQAVRLEEKKRRASMAEVANTETRGRGRKRQTRSRRYR